MTVPLTHAAYRCLACSRKWLHFSDGPLPSRPRCEFCPSRNVVRLPQRLASRPVPKVVRRVVNGLRDAAA